MHRMLHEQLPPTATALLDYLLAAFGSETFYPLGGNTGLPAGGLESLGQNLVLAVTPVTEHLFDEALLRSAGTHGRDTLLVRSGLFPETLDPVRVDVALRSCTGPMMVSDLSFYRARDGALHLVPMRGDLFVTAGPCGLGVSLVAPWNSWDERRRGLERAAAEILRACRRASAG